jgi:hypothetical protein
MFHILKHILSKKTYTKLFHYSVQSFFIDEWERRFFIRPFFLLASSLKKLSPPSRRFIYLWPLFFSAIGMILDSLFPIRFIWLSFIIVFCVIRTVQSFYVLSSRQSILCIGQSLFFLSTLGLYTDAHGQISSLLLIIHSFLCFYPVMTIVYYLASLKQQDRIYPHWGQHKESANYSFLFMVFAFFLMGAPGGLTFFAEDLLFHSLLEIHPFFTISHILLMCFNGIGLYRIYSYLFMGPYQGHHTRLTKVKMIPPLSKKFFLTIQCLSFMILVSFFQIEPIVHACVWVQTSLLR